MFVRAYLRASTEEQDANRARQSIMDFAIQHGIEIAKFYVENESGTKLDRPKLTELIDDCTEGDILLVEDIDRLTRLNADDWKTLKSRMSNKGIKVVALNIPTTYRQMNAEEAEGITKEIMIAVNEMMIEMLVSISRNDYDKRRERQAQGIAKAKIEKKYTGKKPNTKRYNLILDLLDSGKSYSYIREHLGVSPVTISRAKKWREKNQQEST